MAMYFSQKFIDQSNVSQTFETAVKKCIEQYQCYQKAYPNSVLLYVEGVVGAEEENNDSKAELAAVENAINTFASNAIIGLTYVDVVKRVSARFAFREGSYYENVPLGTVVDSTVC